MSQTHSQTYSTAAQVHHHSMSDCITRVGGAAGCKLAGAKLRQASGAIQALPASTGGSAVHALQSSCKVGAHAPHDENLGAATPHSRHHDMRKPKGSAGGVTGMNHSLGPTEPTEPTRTNETGRNNRHQQSDEAAHKQHVPRHACCRGPTASPANFWARATVAPSRPNAASIPHPRAHQGGSGTVTSACRYVSSSTCV